MARQRMQMPLASNAPSFSCPPDLLPHIQHVIQATITPSWVNSVPNQFGESSAGTIKADEWRILSTLYLPIALITFWNDNESSSLQERDLSFLSVLDHSMALFQAVGLLCRYTMTPDRASAYRSLMRTWIQDLHIVHPKTRGHEKRVNVHAALHIYDFLNLFGPVMGWWCFPFERMIGGLQKINTNDKIGGMLSSIEPVLSLI